jgi:hypothetical protein
MIYPNASGLPGIGGEFGRQPQELPLTIGRSTAIDLELWTPPPLTPFAGCDM